MPDANTTHTTCDDNVTHAEHKLILAHRSQLLSAEAEINAIEAATSCLSMMACSDMVEADAQLAKALAFLVQTIDRECQALRGKLYG